MVESISKINIGIMVNASTKIRKNIMHVKKAIFGILLHIFVKTVNI